MSAGTVQSSKGHNDQRVPSNDLTLIDIYVRFSDTYKATLLMSRFTFRGVDRKPPAIQNRSIAPNLAALNNDRYRLEAFLSIPCESS